MPMHTDNNSQALAELASIIRSGIQPSPDPHVLILEDGSKHTGPVVDFVARLLETILAFCDQSGGISRPNPQLRYAVSQEDLTELAKIGDVWQIYVNEGDLHNLEWNGIAKLANHSTGDQT
jgi:hypothetical protein